MLINIYIVCIVNLNSCTLTKKLFFFAKNYFSTFFVLCFGQVSSSGFLTISKHIDFVSSSDQTLYKKKKIVEKHNNKTSSKRPCTTRLGVDRWIKSAIGVGIKCFSNCRNYTYKVVPLLGGGGAIVKIYRTKCAALRLAGGSSSIDPHA